MRRNVIVIVLAAALAASAAGAAIAQTPAPQTAAACISVNGVLRIREAGACPGSSTLVQVDLGPDDPAGGSGGLTGYDVIVETVTTTNFQPAEYTVAAPPGKRVLSGSYRPVGANSENPGRDQQVEHWPSDDGSAYNYRVLCNTMVPCDAELRVIVADDG